MLYAEGEKTFWELLAVASVFLAVALSLLGTPSLFAEA
jgi:hypothetical protein